MQIPREWVDPPPKHTKSARLGRTSAERHFQGTGFASDGIAPVAHAPLGSVDLHLWNLNSRVYIVTGPRRAALVLPVFRSPRYLGLLTRPAQGGRFTSVLCNMSDFKRSAHLLKELIVRIPLILKTLVLHGIQMSPVSGKQDLRTEITTAIIRSFMTFSTPVDKTQKDSMRDPGIKGPMWVSKITLPRPEFDVRDAVVRAIEDLKTTGNETFIMPPVAAVEAEWTGYRSGVGKNTPQPDLTEEEKYQELRRESSSDMTILYFHGGAYL